MWPYDQRPSRGSGTKVSNRVIFLIGAAVVTTCALLFGSSTTAQTYLSKPFGTKGSSATTHPSPGSPGHSNWRFDTKRDAYNYGLTQEQCDLAFPALFTEIYQVTSRRKLKPITKKELTREKWPPGTVRVLVWDQHIYIIDAVEPTLRRSRIYSTMHALNRALMASNDQPLPNIEFIFSIEDWSVDDTLPIWSYDRRPADQNTWLMPDFGFYAWPEPGVGTYSEVRKRMRDVESGISSLADKIQKLVWRGAVTPAVAQDLRHQLVEVTDNKTWSDVQILDWSKKDDASRHRIDIEDHCKYAFIQHTEGRAWSGRLKYVQNCESVIISHNLDWIQHHQHLLVGHGEYQNYVLVENDFSNLPEKMEFLLAHPEEAQRIATNSAKLFRDRYVTPAAEACYWRRLVKCWAEVSFEPEFYGPEVVDGKKKWRGVPFESFAIMRSLEWEPV